MRQWRTCAQVIRRRGLDPDIVALQEVPLDVEQDLGRLITGTPHLTPFSEADAGVGA
jgi:hypothetical protein